MLNNAEAVDPEIWNAENATGQEGVVESAIYRAESNAFLMKFDIQSSRLYRANVTPAVAKRCVDTTSTVRLQ